MSAVIHPSILRLLDDWTLGTIATVDADGAPNLSPKGTFIAVDETALAFAEMRSPNTVRNIARNPRVAINIIDVFGRKGAMFRGNARFVAKGETEFEDLYHRFEAIWGAELGARFRGIVIITIDDVRPVTTPAYDIGADENELRRHWLSRFTKMQERLINE